MDFKENVTIALFFIVLGLMSVWLQFGLINIPDDEISEEEKNDPDYYIENFVSSGMDEDGERYQVIADRLVHYPVGDRALLNNPHIIQHNIENITRHVYADSGWLYNNKTTILMTGNVRVIQGKNADSGGAAAGERMVIQLRESRG